jgi:glycerol-3-phosphate cytidylyltransferase
MDNSNNEESLPMFVKGFTAGVFDLCHSGHLLMLRECKENCDHLTVAVQVDPSLHREGKEKPVETIFERWVRLNECQHVNEVVPYETEEDLINICKTLDYDTRFIGEDHQGKKFTAYDVRPETFFYNSRQHNYSSSDLRKRIGDSKDTTINP